MEETAHREPRATWRLEQHGHIEDGDRVVIDGRLFRVQLVEAPCPPTPPQAVVSNLSLHFGVSTDEEYIELQVRCGSKRWQLKPRAHLYPLLLLARTRLDDRKQGSLPTSAQGWMYQDELVEMLDYSITRLHTEIYRARRQFASLGVRDPTNLIERRASTRQLRIGVDQAELEII